MTAAQLIGLAIQLSMMGVIFCVALHAHFGDVLFLLRKPALLLRSVASMLVVMPLLAVGVAIAFDLNPLIEVALIASTLSPVPPILPGRQIKAGGHSPYVIGLLTVTALVAIVYVPLVAALVGRVFHRPVDVDYASVARIVAMSMLMPVVAGMAVRRWAPAVADRIDKPLSRAAMALLVLALIPVLIQQWPSIAKLFGNFSLVAIIAFSLVGLAVGHLLGGPDPDDRAVLALATCARHPAVALTMTYRNADQPGVLAAVLVVLLVASLVSLPYVRWRSQSHDATRASGPSRA
ncbi:MAG TPA: hypothetical protein VLE94_16195 [Burkholderiaceae bacterium]|nr:hypothetical protein [Burkholderiaceae bacterium]HSB98757.1 hypothetical protein [Burkholderiaceae bacterium]